MSFVLADSLLEVEDLRAYFYTDQGVVRAVDGVSLELQSGEVFGLVGESGCGKTVLALSILNLLPTPPAKIVSGRIVFEGEDLLSLPPDRLNRVRGRRISMVFQDPLSSLNPVLSIGKQLEETIQAADGLGKSEPKKEAISLLELVGIKDASSRLVQYPFQLSGGMRQRVMIALALATSPSLLIADEPTTNLDVTIQAQILSLLRDIQRKLGTTTLLITHNLGIVAWLADRIGVMYAGRIVELGNKELFKKPTHPYTEALLQSVPRVDKATSNRLPTIPGDVPDMISVPMGCRFHPRCPYAKQEICAKVDPPLIQLQPGTASACLMRNPAYLPW